MVAWYWVIVSFFAGVILEALVMCFVCANDQEELDGDEDD